MAKRDNAKIEHIAVNAVEHPFEDIDTMIPRFNENDKGIALDGNIEVYEGVKFEKENFLAYIPVQIKGTAKQPKTDDHIKYRVSVADLRYYFKNTNGMIYFVVSVGKDSHNSKVYYRALLPYDLNKIIHEAGDAGTLTLKFKRFAQDKRTIQRIISEFIRDSGKQTGLKSIGFKTLDDLRDAGIPCNGISFSKTIYSDETMLSPAVFRDGAYIYAISALNEPYVIDKLENIARMAIARDARISSGEISFETKIQIEEIEEGLRFEFDGFRLDLQPQGTINFNDTGTFTKRLQGLRLLKSILDTQDLCIDGMRIIESISSTFDSKAYIEDRMALYSKYVDLLRFLNIKIDWDPEELTHDELKLLDTIATSLNEDRPVPLNDSNAVIVSIEIAGACIIVLTERRDDGCRLRGLYDETIPIGIFSADDDLSELSQVPALFAVPKEYLIKMCNLDSACLRIECEKHINCERVALEGCNKLVQMLSAYDEGAICSEELLKCCDVLSEALCKYDSNSEINLINRLQLLCRKGNLAEADVSLATDLAVNSSDRRVQIAANIILGNEALAVKGIQGLSVDERTEFEAWPIMNLLRKREGVNLAR